MTEAIGTGVLAVFRIQIRIGSVFSRPRDPDPGSVFRMRIPDPDPGVQLCFLWSQHSCCPPGLCRRPLGLRHPLGLFCHLPGRLWHPTG